MGQTCRSLLPNLETLLIRIPWIHYQSTMIICKLFFGLFCAKPYSCQWRNILTGMLVYYFEFSSSLLYFTPSFYPVPSPFSFSPLSFSEAVTSEEEKALNTFNFLDDEDEDNSDEDDDDDDESGGWIQQAINPATVSICVCCCCAYCTVLCITH